MKHSYSKIAALTLALLSITTANANDSDNDRLPTAEELEVATDRIAGDLQEELIAHSLDNIDNPAAQGEAARDQIVAPSSGLHEYFSHTVLFLINNPREDNPWSRVITSQEEWERFFYAPLAYTDYFDGNAPIAPKVDFEKYQILTGGVGIKYSNQIGAEHILSVERVTQLDTEIIIHVLAITPSLDCPTAPTDSGFPSYPSTTVIVKKIDKPFRFEVSNLTNECGQ